VRHLTRGNEGIGAPIILRARSGPNLPSYESLYGLSRTGLQNAPPEASACLYVKSSRLSWEFIGGSSPRATVEGARRSLCKAEACTIGPPGLSCRPSSAVKLVNNQ
jgi:hypothetical protein